ncbi:hypothetical protein HUN01_28755 [Nostoc edaphicum CCNP1411]|uniref:Uncharacterized protein n=1 Tax=Nostoc edaphicum CCNP1411 TaxID=1472755 RepID=A0A7D7QB39_9NOSO|nr:hypothetical protein [Nostoc edaphicum]QMS91395.1 hypothetical protein HUN01_28755 [Nostoc edaphicum CCNP1411]
MPSLATANLSKFSWTGAEVYLQYASEEFGRTAESTLILGVEFSRPLVFIVEKG